MEPSKPQAENPIPEELNLTDLRLFVEIAEKASFSRAAQNLGIPQPTASRRIRKLEDQLGLRLLDRSTRHVRLTDVGITFQEHCLRVLMEVDETLSFAQDQLGEPVGELSVGSNVVLTELLCQLVFPDFIRQYPKVKLIYEEVPGPNIHQPYDGDILVSVFPPQSSKFTALPLVTMDRGFFASAKYLAEQGNPTHPQELNNHCGILLHHGFEAPEQWRWQEAGVEDQVHVPTQVCLTSMLAARRLAIEGLGVSWLPTWLCQEAVQKGELVQLFEGRFTCTYQMYAIYQTRRHQAPKIREFLQLLQAKFLELSSRE